MFDDILYKENKENLEATVASQPREAQLWVDNGGHSVRASVEVDLTLGVASDSRAGAKHETMMV